MWKVLLSFYMGASWVLLLQDSIWDWHFSSLSDTWEDNEIASTSRQVKTELRLFSSLSSDVRFEGMSSFNFFFCKIEELMIVASATSSGSNLRQSDCFLHAIIVETEYPEMIQISRTSLRKLEWWSIVKCLCLETCLSDKLFWVVNMNSLPREFPWSWAFGPLRRGYI